ncbi:MAG: domain S-box protein, partial [Chloroflexi bacterium]|nr:domain S-box protein [Chloroflexota bacterium]
EINSNIVGNENRYFQVQFIPEFSLDGKEVVSVFTIGRDITDFKRANQALKESEKRLSHILEGITDACFGIDNNLNIIYINPQAEKLLKRTSQDLLNKNLRAEFPEAVGTNFMTMYNFALKEMAVVNFQEYYPPLDLWLEVHLYPSADGLLIYFKKVATNIKDMK